ncbi:hypothetical protein M404DRAFT_33214 [Pisolithus tinctorius Marx 270]|uniref:Uncharacterized protein n=1 Tax=Pisolithus tinctorius Marx 270 TaxID=870435 RepID=A0A0C3NME3_PISTI|nr:hypothetical protein M404DRAFT_33214 [Pisolithus tinctorius Marx 270]
MSSQCQSKTPQPTPSHVCDYSQVADEELVILTNDSTNTKEREHKAKCEEAKRQKVEEEWLEAEQKKRAEEEAQRRRVMEEEEAQKKRVAEEEAERQRQRASQERAQARQDKAVQRLTSVVYNVNTTQKVPGASVVVTMTKRAPCTHCILQAVERYAEAHEEAATAFERMARVAEQMAEAVEWTANEWGLYHKWVEWAEMRRRDDACKAKMAKFEHAGGGWERPQSEVMEDKNEEVDEGVEGDNEEEVEGEQEGSEEQEGGREQAMEE